jgi:hypothetical protein
VDCVDSLDWKAGRWEPGGEYVKKLIVKNVSVNTVKIKYELPNTKFFSMEFPQLLTLSPGTFVALDVLFRPIRLEPYDDAIVFRTEAGKFAVRVCSQISSLKVTTPGAIDFGFCPVGETTQKTLVVANTGQKTATFALENGPPFALSPLEGTLAPGESAPVTVSFSPTDATVFVASVVAYVPGLAPLLTKVSGIGKYPYVSASDTRLDWGTVVFGTPGSKVEEKEFELRNQSFVDATFEIVANETDRPGSFKFTPSRGRIPPESHVMVKVRYAPLAPRTFSCDTFTVVTPGGNDVEVTCVGRSEGPRVTLEKKAPGGGKPDAAARPRLSRPSSLQFGDVRIGGVTSRVVYLTNHSLLPVPFQFVVEDKGTFLFNRTAGVIPPKLQTHVTIFFEPKVSGNFYRRIFCLFKDQLPLCIDCIGTGYADLSRRPPPLSLAQVDAHRRRQRAGTGHLSPAELEELLARDPAAFDLRQVDVSPCGGHPTRLSRSGEATELELGIVSQFFEPQCGAGKEVRMEQEYLDFGGCSRTRHPEPRPVRIFNNTNAKVTCMWRVPESDDDDDQADFMVLPPQADIPARGSFVFKVAFLPTQNDFYYNQEVEAYVFFKSNRNFRLVNERTLTPPWCLTIPVFGHTFGNASSQFLPRCRTSLRADNKVHFPPCYVGDSVYQTFQVVNDSDTPSTYKIEQDSTGVFTVKPTYGVISPGEFILVACRFSPAAAGPSAGSVSLVMNNSAGEATKFEMVGTGCETGVEFENGGALYFKPTSTGIVTSRGFAFRNTSRVPVVYRWELPAGLEGAVGVEPSAGRLGGNERARMTWTFAPRRTGVYHGKAVLWTRPLGGNKSLRLATKRFLNVVAEGRQGAVAFEPEQLDMGTTLVGAEVTKVLTLSNTSDADLHFRLESILASDYDLLDADHDGEISAAELRSYSRVRSHEAASATPAAAAGPQKLREADVANLQAASMLGFAPSLGLLPARSRLKVMVTYRPSHPTTNRFRIFCDVVVAGADNSGVWDQSSRAAALSPRTRDRLAAEANDIAPLTCDLVGRAAYPTLKVVDARSALLSPATLWDQFALRQLNFELSTPLTRDQIRLNTRTGVGDKELDHLYQNFLWEFTPRPAGAPAEVVLLSFKNVSKLPLEFAFKMPNENDVEIEQWADAGEPTEDELRQNSIVDARLFEIEPRAARLAEGETATIRLSYRYVSTEFGGDHCLPVLFKLSKGKQVRVWLRGRTLPPAQARLYAPCADAVRLAPVPIGHAAPPTQTLALRNPSDCDVEYQIDMAAFAALREENYGFPVFACPDLEEGETAVRGYIERGATASVPLVFQPLEAKAYAVDLPVTYRGAHGEPCATGEALGAGVREPVTSEEAQLALRVLAHGFHPAPAAAVDKDAERGLPSLPKDTPLGLDSEAHLERVRAAATRAHDRDGAAMVAGERAEATRSHHGEDAPEFGPPPQQELAWDGMIARLSMDRLAFGQVPAGCLTNAVTTIHNTARGAVALEFAWDRDHPALATGTLKVYPRAGKIPPGGSTVCKWTMQTSADDTPEVLAMDVRCFISGQAEAPKGRGGRGRRGGSRRGTASRARSTRASSPTGSVLSRTSVVDRTTTASRGGLMESLASIGTTSRRPETGSTVGTGGAMARSGSRLTRDSRADGGPPPAAASCMLFVNVSGEIVDPKAFRQMSQERGGMDRFFTPRLPPKAGEAADEALRPPRRVISGATEDMRSLAGTIMSELIDDLIADPSIEHLVNGIAPPPPPYFCQLSGATTPRLNGPGAGAAGRGEPTAEQAVAERKQTLQDVESQELIARIMENTVFNLIQDVAAGEFDLAETPRRFVKLDGVEAEGDAEGKDDAEAKE